MRRVSVIFLSAVTGAALALLVAEPRTILIGSSARSAESDAYRQLNLFGDVFERVRDAMSRNRTTAS
jgi:carboxyl-terminal processing protease